MKIRSGFVSNSSSSSFIVAVPKNYAPTRHQVDKAIVSAACDEFIEKENYYEEIISQINVLKEGGEIYQYEDNDLFCILSLVFGNDSLVLGETDCRSDSGIIVNILTDRNRKIIHSVFNCEKE